MLLLASAAAAQAQQTINVTRTDDPTGAGDCTTADSSCSLRQAVAAASTGDTIDLPSGTYDLTQGTDIDITQSITLEGTGVDSTSIDGSQNSGSNEYGELARILKVQGTTVTIEDLTMTGGVDDEDENLCGGCSRTRENGGGALFNDGGAVTLTDVAFLDDPGGAAPGAAIGNNGTLNMSDVTFTGDGPQTLFTHGGAITGNEVTFQDDADGCCDYDGGAAYLDGGTVTLTNTTVVGSGGSASIGGGIDNATATLTLTNDTLSGNTRGSLQTDPEERPMSRTRSSALATRTAATAIASPPADRTTSTAKIRARRSRTTSATTSTRTARATSPAPPTSRTRTPTWHRSSTTAVACRRRHCCPAARPSAIPPARAARRWMPRDRPPQ